jgi:hypothetical protein
LQQPATHIYVTDERAFLTPHDIALLTKRMKERLKKWSYLGAIATLAAVAISGKITTGWLVFGFAIVVALWTWYASRRTIEKNHKLITRGVVSARWARDDEGRKTGIMSSYTLVVNGKNISVDAVLYEKYFARDVVEFSYLEDGFILSDKLLKR